MIDSKLGLWSGRLHVSAPQSHELPARHVRLAQRVTLLEDIPEGMRAELLAI